MPPTSEFFPSPTLPQQNEAISRKILLVLGALFGASFGAMVGFFSARKTIAPVTAQAITDRTKLPLLAELPNLETRWSDGKTGTGGIMLPKLFDLGARTKASNISIEPLYLKLRGREAQAAKATPEILLISSTNWYR